VVQGEVLESLSLSSPDLVVREADPGRLSELVKKELAPLWRFLRRLGLTEAEADDGAQQVFIVVARRLDEIDEGRERAFVFSTALNVAAKLHRSRNRRREVSDDELEERRDSLPGLDELIDRRRARALLDEILEAMAEDIRIVFVLYEIEELTMAEIATVLEVPPGTVASRLRRARTDFNARVARIEKRMKP
jgi:RNA polymerase sigma-70 factor, ECF subfamily